MGPHKDGEQILGGARWRRRAALVLLDLAKGTHCLSVYRDLMASQWLPEDQLRRMQDAALRQLVRHAHAHVPYYRRLFQKLRLSPEDMATTADLARLPVLTREEARWHVRALRSRRLEGRPPRPKRTSGSTGEPLEFVLDAGGDSYVWPNIWRAFGAAGYTPGAPVAMLGGAALIGRAGFLARRLHAAMLRGLLLPADELTPAILSTYVERLKASAARILYCYPSAGARLADHALRTGVDLRLAAVFATSEMLDPNARALMESAFHCLVYDLYGCLEGGLFACECERHAGLHQAMENGVIEIVDETGNRVPAGVQGRIVSTSLRNYAMPLLRYDTGDLGVLAPGACPCGRGLVRLSRVIGRSAKFVVAADGRRIHGVFFAHQPMLYRMPWVLRFQVAQEKAGEVVMRLLPRSEPVQADIDRLTEDLRRGLGPGTGVRVETVRELPLTRAGKSAVIQSTRWDGQLMGSGGHAVRRRDRDGA